MGFFFFKDAFSIVFDVYFYLFIYLPLLGLSWSMWDLRYLLWQVGYLVVACELLAAMCGTWFPHQGSNPGFLQWEGILDTGPPQGSHYITILFY